LADRSGRESGGRRGFCHRKGDFVTQPMETSGARARNCNGVESRSNS
jgi:hypothetical protein